MSSERKLGDVVGRQLQALIEDAHLQPAAANRLTEIYSILTAESLNQRVGSTYPGLSHVNANGMPFQWSLCVGGPPSVRFLCECGIPGTSGYDRLTTSIVRLSKVCAIADLSEGVPDWYRDVLATVLPPPHDWPPHWRSAMWIGVGASGNSIGLKPYLNLNRDAPIDRWRRVGWVFKMLGRNQALERLCELSSRVSEQSWPVGLAVDIGPSGRPGRIKAYFRSGPVTDAWLHEWYDALGATQHFGSVRTVLDAFPHPDRAVYEPGSFVVTLEAQPNDGNLTLKTDLGVTHWVLNDRAISSGICQLLNRLGLSSSEYDGALQQLSARPLSSERAEVIRYVGLGYESDGSRHINIYLEPPVGRPAPSRQRPSNDIINAVGNAARWLAAAQRDGRWTDYGLPVGMADQWVTAYVLAQLGTMPRGRLFPTLAEAVRLGLDWLVKSRTETGGWGYNATTGDDADSTGLAVIGLRAFGRPVPPDALAVLRRCRVAGAGVATYPPGTVAAGAWTTPVPDVTPTVLTALQLVDPADRAWLLDRQDANGLWEPYWWLTPLYPTAAVIDYLTSHAWGQSLQNTIQTVGNYVPNGAFESALLLKCRSTLGAGDIAGLVEMILSEQNSDGSWPASAHLRLTRPDVYEPAKGIDVGTTYSDQMRIVTTITVMSALDTARFS